VIMSMHSAIAKKAPAGERFFSLELKSKNAVRTASFGNGKSDRVTIEGTIGVLERAGFVEDSVLELTGTGGVLRVDLSSEDLAKHSMRSQEAREI